MPRGKNTKREETYVTCSIWTATAGDGSEQLQETEMTDRSKFENKHIGKPRKI